MNTENPAASIRIEQLRDELVNVRRSIQEFEQAFPMWKHKVEHVAGLTTCGIVTLAYSKDEVIKHEIKQEDKKHGPHLAFRSRGIGLDACPCCFACGTKLRAPGANDYLHNISAFVASKEDGQQIVGWFGLGARLDWRESEPGWIQVKVGACSAHKGNLEKLDKLTSKYGIIRVADIIQAREYSPST